MDPETLLKLATLLANGVDVRPGDAFPIGWDNQRNRIYAIAGLGMLEEAKKLVPKGDNPRILPAPSFADDDAAA